LFKKTSSTHTTVGGSIVGVNLNLVDMNIKEKFGQKVKLLREQQGISIEYLANISNVDRNYIADIEKGKRNVSITIIEKIIFALDTDFTTFFNDKNFKK
jgi:DNA-binding XRE family transcriptional regulator